MSYQQQKTVLASYGDQLVPRLQELTRHLWFRKNHLKFQAPRVQDRRLLQLGPPLVRELLHPHHSGTRFIRRCKVDYLTRIHPLQFVGESSIYNYQEENTLASALATPGEKREKRKGIKKKKGTTDMQYRIVTRENEHECRTLIKAFSCILHGVIRLGEIPVDRPFLLHACCTFLFTKRIWEEKLYI